MRYPYPFVAALLLVAAASHAQAPLAQWHHLGPSAEKAMGIGTDREYALLRTLPARPAPRPIIVAVIDGGVDTAYIDLKRVLRHNPGEVPANGLDDAHNILASAAPMHTPMRRPGSKQQVDFATRARTGGIVNLYEAVRLASPLPAEKTRPAARR